MNVSILGRFKNFLIHCLYLVIDDIPNPQSEIYHATSKNLYPLRPSRDQTL